MHVTSTSHRARSLRLSGHPQQAQSRAQKVLGLSGAKVGTEAIRQELARPRPGWAASAPRTHIAMLAVA